MSIHSSRHMLSSLWTVLTCFTFAVLVIPLASPYFSRQKQPVKRDQSNTQLQKRFEGTRWTFYDSGLGACFQYNAATDFIVALNAEQYGDAIPSSQCNKTITMSYGGKTTNAVIMDKCPGCPYGGLDLTTSLFSYFADMGEGWITGDWYFADGSGGPLPQQQLPTSPSPPPPPPPPPTPTSTPAPPPPQTTSSAVLSSSAPSSSAATSSQPTSTISSGGSGPNVPNPTASGDKSFTLDVVNQAILALARLSVVGAKDD